LDLVAERQLGVGVDIDLDQVKLAFAFLGLPFERRAERPAGAAPGGPEVDHHRQLMRALEHVALEGLDCYIHLSSSLSGSVG